MAQTIQIIKLILLLLILPAVITADERLRLVQADILENIVENGTSVQILTGDVIFQKGDLTLFCDRARYIERTGQGYLIGSAKAKTDSNFISADTLHFDSPNDLLIARGRSHAWDDEYDLTSKLILYYSKIDSGIAIGDAVLKQKKQIITADTLVYSNPVKKKGANYSAFGNVKIISAERTITCGQAKYNLENEIAELTLNPVVISDKDELSGEKLIAHFKEEELQYLLIPNLAKASSKQTNEIIGEYSDDMSGRVLKAYFVEGSLDSMRIEGMATSLYHVFNDSTFQGVNTTSGDTITLQFKNQELQNIFISGGARGVYAPDTSNTSLGSEINYSADNIDYQIPDETTQLIGEAKVDYTDLNLTAGYIGVNWQTNILDALPIAKSDTTSRQIIPALTEKGQESLFGNAMKYNLQTEHGKITRGKTKIDDGHFTGSEIRNEDKNIFYMKKIVYSTCDLDTPHFHFSSPKMKMIQNDKIIAKPIFLNISQIPILGLPFAILPSSQSGRQSGWIMPSYGTSSLRGNYLDGFGYYWAVNDYFDTRILASFADLQGVVFKSINKYNNRYKYSGQLHLETRQYLPSGLASGEKDIFDIFGPRKKDYVFKWTHRQLLRRNQSLNVNASYYSNGDYNYTTSINQNRRLTQQAISNLTYSKSWKKSNNSISVNLSSKTDLMANRKIDVNSSFYQAPLRAETQLNITTNTLPSLSFRHGQRPIFATKSSEKSWFNNITYNYSANFNNKNKKYYESVGGDSDGEYIWETDSNGDPIESSKSDKLLAHSFSLSAPQKIFRYISINPRLSIKSDWVDEYYVAGLDTNYAYESVKQSGFATRTTGSIGVINEYSTIRSFPN